MRIRNRAIRPILMTTMIAALASCSVVNEEMAKVQPAGHKTTTARVTPATHVKMKTYAFSSAEPVVLAMQEESVNKPVQAERPTYLGSAPYICSPSGFGRKSQCFQR